MPETVRVLIDGRAVDAESGVTIAAAAINAGERALRTSIRGERRGVLCAMGICFECRVTVDGHPHRRACMDLVRDGMSVETRAGGTGLAMRGQGRETRSARLETVSCDVAVVGGGPAGVAAACRAAEVGRRTLLLDENLAAGGQIYRRRPDREPPPKARPWLQRLARSGAAVRNGICVFDAVREKDGWRLSASTDAGDLIVRARAVILATGARELFLPFPGWTLPGVYGAGGAQALWKTGASMRGRRALVAGSGPLLLPVASSLARAGARVVLIAEQAPLAALTRFAGSLASSPGKLLEALRYRAAFAGAPYRSGTWVKEARGDGGLERLVLTDGAAEFEVRCDVAAVGYGLVPNVELPRLAGCAIEGDRVTADASQRSSVPDVFCAGEICGVAGLETAIAEGEIAGLAAADRWEESSEAPRLTRARARGRRRAARMDATFAPREELRALSRADTIVCRCEDVPLGRIASCGSAREAKLSTRAGMGPCQGRVCGPALRFLFGWDWDTVRPPIKPTPLGSLVSVEELA